MTDKEYVLDTMRASGLSAAEALQERSPEMTGTELYAREQYIPDFIAAAAAKNMLERKAGQTDGFVCRSSAGRVVRLIQNYDSTIYTGEPEELPAQWRFVWSTDPKKALPFIALSTSPYAAGDCCTYPVNGQGEPSAEGTEIHVFKSGQEGNVWAPGTVNVSWEDLGTIEDILAGTAPEPEEPETGSDEPEAEEGTVDDPITAERGMAYVYGKYYLDPEDGVTYICQRAGEAEGGTVTLYYLPHELIGNYFTAV